MQHLKGFGLENFRVFKDYTWFDFAPITLLIGPNSSGKSSLIKALLLMKDNFEKQTIPSTWNDLISNKKILFENKNHELSDGEHILNKDSQNSIIKFSFPITLECFENQPLNANFSIKVNKTDSEIFSVIDISTKDGKPIFYLNKDSIYLDMPFILENLPQKQREFYEEPMGDEIYQKIFDKFSSNTWKSNQYHFENDNEYTDIIFNDNLGILQEQSFPREENIEDFKRKANEYILIEKLIKISQENYYPSNNDFLKLNGDDLSKQDGSIIAIFVILGLMQVRSKSWDDYYDKESIIKDGGLILGSPIKDNFEFLNNIDYLPTNKGVQKRGYQTSEEHLINNLIKEVKKSEKLKVALESFINQWKSIFGIDNFNIGRNSNLDQNYIQIDGKSIIDVGFGISQLSAIFLKIVTSQDKILIIEEPEANLHPAFQSKLADMFLDAQKTFEQQFIIETHSEYMVRKFQYLVAKGEMKKEDIVIYYFNDPNNIPAGEPQVKKIEILEDGSLSDDFGSGFFDEAANWELELLRLKKNKIRQN